MKRLFISILILLSSQAYAETVTVTIPSQVSSFMDTRHYDPSEIDALALPANTNGEKTYYVDGTNGDDDECNGLYPTYTGGGAVCSADANGPYKSPEKPFKQYEGHQYGERVLFLAGEYIITSALMDNVRVFTDNVLKNTDSHWNTIAPYGDGEVIFNLSETDQLGTFTTLSGNIYQASYGGTWSSSDPVDWAVLDYNAQSARQSIGYTGTDSSGSSNKTTSMVDTSSNIDASCSQAVTRDFVDLTWDDCVRTGSLTTDFVGGIIWNITDDSWGVVTSISTTTNSNDTINFSAGLSGGTDNDFDNGDSYAVYEMGADGEFTTIGGSFFIRSDSGNPTSRNLIAQQIIASSSSSKFVLRGQAKRWLLYGITLIGANNIGVDFQGDGMKVKVQKCRFMFNGKSGASYFGDGMTQKFFKNFWYGNVMANWPRGNYYGGNGGWTNAMTNAGYADLVDGNITLDNGGEGTPSATITQNNISYNNWSMGIYVGDLNPSPNTGSVTNNVVVNPGYDATEAESMFYLQSAYNSSDRTYTKQNTNAYVNLSNENSGPGNPPTGWEFYNNLIIGGRIGVYFERDTAHMVNSVIANNTIILSPDQTRFDPDFGITSGVFYPTTSSDTGNVFKNNLIISSSLNTDAQHFLVQTYRGTDYSGYDWDQNVYSFPSNELFYPGSSASFSTWKSTTGFDANSVMVNSQLLDTTSDFLDMSLLDKSAMKLVAGSLAIDTGADLSSSLSTDYDFGTRPFNSTFDVGAFEYLATPNIPDLALDEEACSVDGDCLAGSQCCSSVCKEEACGSGPDCTLNTFSCSDSTDCCSGYCCSDVCVASSCPEAGDLNIAVFKTAVASSDRGGNVASGVTDNIISYFNMWQSKDVFYDDPQTQWVYVDLEAGYFIGGATIEWTATYTNGYAQTYSIQTSDNATDWTTIYTTTEGNGGQDIITGLSGYGRYVRLLCDDPNNASGGYQVPEFKIYEGSSEGSSNPTTVIGTVTCQGVTFN